MAKVLKRLIVFSNGKKMEIPDANKIIVTARDANLKQHQASMDITVPNITELKKVIRRTV